MTDRYRIDVAHAIGHGAFGKIFPCQITTQFHEYLSSNGIQMPLDTTSKLFAVKVQSYDALFQGQLSLLREIDVLMRTKNYPGTVELFDFFLCDETQQAFLILKMASCSLDNYICDEKDIFKRIEFLPFLNAQMLLHLGYLKHNSIAHRDVKPPNILLQKAPQFFGWTLDKSVVDVSSKSRFFSVDRVRLNHYETCPIKQLCRYFLPMAENCHCFDSETEHHCQGASKMQFKVQEESNQEQQSKMRQISEKQGSVFRFAATNAFENGSKLATRVGSCPSRNLYDSFDTMDEDDADICEKQPRESILPIYMQPESSIWMQQKTMHFSFLCDFGLSKHMNKTHHSPYIVTPNFRSPELFDPISFSRVDENNNHFEQGQIFAANDALKKSKLRSSLLLSTQNSTNSPSSSDPNDVSLKREEDLAYSESIDVWGLGCTLAQLVTGKPLFPGKNLQTVYNAIKALFSGTSTRTWTAKRYYTRDENNDDDGEKDDDDDENLFALDEERGFVNAYGDDESDEQLLWHSGASPNWITSVGKRTERIRQKIFLQILSSTNQATARRACDLLGNEFFDMLAKMLDPDPRTRPHAEQLLTHKFAEPFVKPSLTLIFLISIDQPKRTMPMKSEVAQRVDHNWWAFQQGLRAGGFKKNQLVAVETVQERKILLEKRELMFRWMLDVVRSTKCRYQTLFSALYHFERCIANFPRIEARATLLIDDNYELLALCCFYLTVRYYERIYITVEALEKSLKLLATKQRLEKFVAIFLGTICGQLTLPSPWHFVLLCFNSLVDLRQNEFSSITHYKTTLSAIFQRRMVATKKLKKRYTRERSKDKEQLFAALKLISATNNNLLAENLRADARAPKSIYTSHFKKHCSRLLYLMMLEMGEPYLQHNNRAMGKVVFKRCLFNALFVESFERLQLRHENIGYSRSTVTLVRSRYN